MKFENCLEIWSHKRTMAITSDYTCSITTKLQTYIDIVFFKI